MTPTEAATKARVDIPLRGFNLTQYLTLRNPMGWDFAKVNEAMAELETEVKEVKAALREENDMRESNP